MMTRHFIYQGLFSFITHEITKKDNVRFMVCWMQGMEKINEVSDISLSGLYEPFGFTLESVILGTPSLI